MTTAQAKHIKTKEKYRGNQYGHIYKHSKVDRYYGIQVGDKIICEDMFLSLNGARLGAELIKLGLTESDLNVMDCDSHAAIANKLAKWANLSVQDYLVDLAKKILADYKLSRT